MLKLKVPIAAAVAAVLLGSTGYCAFNERPGTEPVTVSPPADLTKTETN